MKKQGPRFRHRDHLFPHFYFESLKCPGIVVSIWLYFFASVALSQTNFTILKSFTSAPDGAVPYCTLVAGTNSVLYGTTIIGGTSNLGTVFSMNLDGSGYNALHSFSGPTDGSGPFAGVLL